MTTYYFFRQPKNFPKEIFHNPADSTKLHMKEFPSRKKAEEYRQSLEMRDNDGRLWNLEEQFVPGRGRVKFDYYWVLIPYSQARGYQNFNCWECNKLF